MINSNLGWNVQQNQTKSFTVRTEGFPNENLDYISFATQYEKSGSPEGDEYTSRLVGFLGNLNYSYDERFLVDLSFREDASSQFGRITVGLLFGQQVWDGICIMRNF